MPLPWGSEADTREHEALAFDLAVSCEPYRPNRTKQAMNEGAYGQKQEEEMQGKGETFALRMSSPALAQVNDGEPERIPWAEQSSFQDGLHWSTARHQRKGERQEETAKWKEKKNYREMLTERLEYVGDGM